ncbi:amidohydrolase [Pedomonas sp. V897]|uniref:amidohydrolase n=1 Tax=Pedomonas sp. V897 TaxID=3446482 RepID=UPI003EE3CA17
MKSFLACAAAVVALMGAAPVAVAADTQLRADIARDYDQRLKDLFIDFHKNPELSFRETRTAARIAKELKALGIQVTEGVGRTGVVGVLRNGEGPTVLIRADMDGLPVEEKSGLPYASTVRQVDMNGKEMPVMHACGHDVHITALLGTAKQLVARKNQWKGTVVFVAQPAEEVISGAREMLEDGLYTRFPRPNYAIGFHVSSDLPAGKVMVEPGLTYSSSDSVDIIVHGVGAHGASPHRGKDPIVIGSQIVLALQTLVSREISPLQPGVVTVGAFHSGLKHNIISDRAELQLTVRSDDQEVREQLLAGIKRIAENVGRMAGLPEDKLPEVRYSTQSTPPTVNDPEATALVRAAILDQLGAENLTTRPRTGMGAEDFAYYSQRDPKVAGVYFAVGGTPQDVLDAAEAGGPPVPAHHSPLFKITPEPAVKAGVEATTAAALALLGKS